MNKLILIHHLETQIKQEINRLEKSGGINLEKETFRLEIYQQLVQII